MVGSPRFGGVAMFWWGRHHRWLQHTRSPLPSPAPPPAQAEVLQVCGGLPRLRPWLEAAPALLVTPVESVRQRLRYLFLATSCDELKDRRAALCFAARDPG